MNNEIVIKKATFDDIPFIIDAIVYSERSGQNYSFYERAFDFDELQLRELIKSILIENIPGSELCYDNFTILFVDNKPVSTLASWIEGSGNQSSNFIKSTIFSFMLPKEKWKNAQKAIDLINKISIKRSPKIPQIESVFVTPQNRGKGYLLKMMNYIFNLYESSSHSQIEMISVEGNLVSVKAFKKCKFEIKNIIKTSDTKVLEIFPGMGKILWIKKLNELVNKNN